MAQAAGCYERTVCRHFPTKERLAAAFWDWQYWILGPRDWNLGTEAELVALIERSFRAFDEHPELVRAMLHARHGRDARLSENDERRAMAQRRVDDAVPGLSRQQRRRAAAATQLRRRQDWHALRPLRPVQGDVVNDAAMAAMYGAANVLGWSALDR